MNSHYSTSSPSHGHSSPPPSHLIPKVHRTPINNSEPAFMQPLLPPQPLQDAYTIPHASQSSCPSLSTPTVYSVHPPTIQAQMTAAHLQQLQSQAPPPYGPENSDEEYPLNFSSLEEFTNWRAELEDQESVEFVKAEMCRSETIPPGFNELIKLTCSRNIKNTRHKYVNALPDRNRTVPNRNIEGDGCPASIWYKTYFDSSVIRAKYFYQHSHPLGRENFSFTRRGRKFTGRERSIHHQDEFSRTTPATQGTILPTANDSNESNNREMRNQEVLSIEPPPMASLRPPDPSLENTTPVSVGYQQKQHSISYAQLSPPQSGFSCAPFQNGVYASPPVSHHPESYDRNYGNDLALFSEPASVVPPIARSSGRNQACRPPPPHLPTYTSNAQVHQPQPTYQSQTEPMNCHAQYLPTPTTPTTHPQNWHSQPYPQPYSEAPQRREAETHNQAAPIPNGSHTSPVSPVTPQTQALQGPPVVASDGRAILTRQYHPADLYVFDEDRWNRLETLFQVVRLRARTYPVPGSAIATLEMTLSQIYMDSQQTYPRSEGDQLLTYQQRQQ